jgi:hypothetical protein
LRVDACEEGIYDSPAILGISGNSCNIRELTDVNIDGLRVLIRLNTDQQDRKCN